MFFRIFKPCVELRDHVEMILVAHSKSKHPDSLPFKPFPPAPEQCLYFYPRQRVLQKNALNEMRLQPFSIVVGPQVTRIDLQMAADHMMVGVVFRAGSLHRLLGIPMAEVFDHYIDSSLIWPAEIRALEEQMNATQDYVTLVGLAEAFLKQQFAGRIKEVHPIDRVFNYMLKPDCSYSIDALAREACLSVRQFDRKFYDRIGMSPKMFSRIIRFSNAYRMKDAAPDLDWLSIALHNGYYDFQHMLRDFKEFAGTTPTVLREQDLVTDERVYTYSSSSI